MLAVISHREAVIQSFVLSGLGDKLVFHDALIRTAVVRR